MFVYLVKPVLLVLCVTFPAWLICRIIWLRQKKSAGFRVVIRHEIILLFFVMYIASVLAITISPASILGFNAGKAPIVNIVPVINSYKYFISTLAEPDGIAKSYAIENIIGNLLLFLPVGIFLPILNPKFKRLKNVLLLCFFCSLSIESIQYGLRQLGTYRTVDIDDVILNTIGGLLGWLIYFKIITRCFISSNYSTKTSNVAS